MERINLQPLFILQKKAVRIMTFSNFDEHSSPLAFKQLKIVKLYDLVTLHNVVLTVCISFIIIYYQLFLIHFSRM